MAAERLDSELASRGLARSRTHAAKLVAAGLVQVDGTVAIKPSARIADGADIAVTAGDPYVSRAAHKLLAALDEFDVSVTGRLALDAGASTGGFTQVLLERGARAVIAVDVGHGQLAPDVAEDPGVIAVEGCNVRNLSRSALAALTGISDAPQVITADLSFISLRTVLPALRDVASADADFILLVKPQFEVGRTGIREGIVRDVALRNDAVMGVLWTAHDLGLRTAGVRSSPITGTHGNAEYLVWLNSAVGEHPTEWMDRVSSVTGGRG